MESTSHFCPVTMTTPKAQTDAMSYLSVMEAALYSDFDMSLDRETEGALALAQMSFNTSRQIH